jgi:hypothetical protein
MRLVYSALQDTGSNSKAPSNQNKPVSRKLRLRYRGYQAACQKYEQEIAAIQQYLPGWKPAFK